MPDGRHQTVVRSPSPLAHLLTGTFLCVMKTAVSWPRIAIAVCPDPEMALKAYSGVVPKAVSVSDVLTLDYSDVYLASLPT